MQSNTGALKSELEAQESVDQVHVDGTSSEAILRAIVNDYDEAMIEATINRSGADAEIVYDKYVGFGTEVEIR